MTDKVEAAARSGGKGRVLVLALSVLLAAIGGVLLAAGPALFRMGAINRDFARFDLPDVAMYVMFAAVAVALVGLVWALVGSKHRAAIVAILVTVGAGIAGGNVYANGAMRHDLPPINDIQTDWTRPVAFTEKALKEREHAGAIRVRDDAVVPAGNGKWSGLSYAQAQQEFYKDLEPLSVKQSAPQATVAAAKAARRLGWDVLMENPPDGMVEAVYHEGWYDLVYDIAVRVTPEGQGSRIDVRSTSRTPDRDMGESATQVKQLLYEIQQVLM